MQDKTYTFALYLFPDGPDTDGAKYVAFEATGEEFKLLAVEAAVRLCEEAETTKRS